MRFITALQRREANSQAPGKYARDGSRPLLKTITTHVTLAALIILAVASLPPIAKADESPKEHPALRR
jgi:hypothetical protein